MRWNLAKVEVVTLGLVELLDAALTSQVSRSLRRAYGNRAEDCLADAVRHITLANTRTRLKDRLPLIAAYLDDLELLEAYLRAMHQPNNGGLSTRKKSNLDMVIDDLDRQARAWKNDTYTRLAKGQTEARAGSDIMGESRFGNDRDTATTDAERESPSID